MAVYQGLEATLHEAFWGDRGSDLEVKDLIRQFPDFQGRALEVGAGSGRIMRPLIEQGWTLDGIEPSSAMVEMARESGVETISEVKLEDYAPTQKYDLILLTSYVFQLFPEPQAVFTKLKSLLNDGGRIYFSIFIPWSEIVGEIPEGDWLVDDQIILPTKQKARCMVNFELDRVRQKLTRNHRYELIEKKKIIETTKTVQEIRYYTLAELELQCEKAGYKVDAISYEFAETYDSDAHSMALVLSDAE